MSENAVRLYAYQCAEYYLPDRHPKLQQNQCTDPPNMRQKEIRELVEKNGKKWARNLEKWGFVDKPLIFW